MLFREAAGPRPTTQEKWTFGFDRVRVLVCTIAVAFVIRPSSLVGRHIGKRLKYLSIFLLFSQNIRIVGC